jgi:hypothetical protein
MKKTSLVLRAFAVTLLVPLPGLAVAPPEQYEFFDSGSILIEDKKTFLDWERDALKDVAHADIGTVCATRPNLAGGRVPTVKELLTIVDESPHNYYDTDRPSPTNVTRTIDPRAFPDTPTDKPYWTSTPAGVGQAWTVNFETGAIEPASTAGVAHLRCVR